MAKKTAQGPFFPVGFRGLQCPKEGPFTPIFVTIEKLFLFFFCSAMKIRHGTERALQTGPEVTNDEESIGKPLSFPLSEHQK